MVKGNHKVIVSRRWRWVTLENADGEWVGTRSAAGVAAHGAAARLTAGAVTARLRCAALLESLLASHGPALRCRSHTCALLARRRPATEAALSCGTPEAQWRNSRRRRGPRERAVAFGCLTMPPNSLRPCRRRSHPSPHGHAAAQATAPSLRSNCSIWWRRKRAGRAKACGGCGRAVEDKNKSHGLGRPSLLFFKLKKVWVPILNPNPYPISSKQRICLPTFISQSITSSIFPSP